MKRERTVVARKNVYPRCYRRSCVRFVVPGEGGARGLCGACYRYMNKLVNGGATTFAEQEERGNCLPARETIKQEWVS